MSKGFYQRGKTTRLDSEVVTSYTETIKKIRCYLNLKSDDIILDIGCGGGNLSAALLNLNFTVIGMDLSRKNISDAKKINVTMDLVIGDAENLPFKTASADTIFAFGLLEHLPNPQFALREMRRSTKSSGTLVLLQTFRLDDYQKMWHRLLYSFGLTRASKSELEKQHINQFNPAIWASLLAKNSFSNTVRYTTSVLPTFPLYYLSGLLFPALKRKYFNLPLIKEVDDSLKSMKSISDFFALAHIYIARKVNA
jgi:2-polyprenyl-3-methyl-5-hydroxy-6-metoxy-1,4-benzoquinol methylase